MASAPVLLTKMPSKRWPAPLPWLSMSIGRIVLLDMWLLIWAAVASVIAGATKPEQVRANAAAAGWVLTPDEVAEIAASAREQASGIDQVTKAIGQMDQATQQNAALVEQSAAGAESLRQQAHQLVQAVAVFKLSSH